MSTEKYLYNIGEIIYELAEQDEEVECLDDFYVTDTTLVIGIKTLTEESDPSVGYYYDGRDSIDKFILELKERLQITSIKFVDDVDIGADDEGWDCWIVKHGDLVINL